jgi:hypothetical protein
VAVAVLLENKIQNYALFISVLKHYDSHGKTAFVFKRTMRDAYGLHCPGV